MASAATTVTTVGVVLMTYGSPRDASDVATYLMRVRGGRDPDPDLVREFQRRYEVIGGSPLVEITRQQASALERALRQSVGARFRVRAAMRFSDPFIHDIVRELAEDATVLMGIILSPQYSPLIMGGYRKALEEAAQTAGKAGLRLIVAADWHLQPCFIRALARQVGLALRTLPASVRKTAPVLFSAHSMPKRVVDAEPEYVAQLRETATAVAREAGLSARRWMFCYQSAGHTPEEWLKPDVADVLPELRRRGHTHALIAPVQFLSDHLETLYDIDIAARMQAEQHGIVLVRTASLNTSPLFIKSLADVARDLFHRLRG